MRSIYYGRQFISEEDIQSVVEVLKSDYLTQGPKVEEFESALCKKFGAKHCCVVSNGTAALHLAGIGLGWGPEDIIITSPITFLASANCILYAGAIPDFADIDPATYTIDPNKVEDKVKVYHSKGKTVKAVVGVDYAGHPCDWKALRSIADKYDMQLINDNCHAIGSSYYGHNQYAVKFADVVIQSYHPVKHITAGEGGAVITNNLHLNSKIRSLRSHGITKNSDTLEKSDGPWYYEMHELGFNYRITDFQCALGSSQLKKLDQFVEKRQQIAIIYDKAFANNDVFLCPQVSENVNHAYHLYPLQINYKKAGLSKKQYFEELRRNGINLQVHYIPVHTQPFYRKNFGFNYGDFPVAESFYQNEVSLPIYPSLNTDNVKKVVDSVFSVLNV